LQLKIFAGEVDDYFSLGSNYGVHVFIHNKTVTPSYFQGMDVVVSKETTIMITKQFADRLGPPYGTCVDDLANYKSQILQIFIKNNRYYRQRYCHNYCFARKLVDVCTTFQSEMFQCACILLFIYDMKVCGCYATTYNLDTFGSTIPCLSYSQFSCQMNLFSSFFTSGVIANCSAECPDRCDNLNYYTSVSFSEFPAGYYYYVMMANNQKLAARMNLTPSFVQSALINNSFDQLPPLDAVQKYFDKKTLSLNVYFEELLYTTIVEEHKLEIIDLIAGIGGTMVKMLFY
jgi:hypothetical protein